MVSSGLFRQDLFYRLNTLVIELPPLRQRLADLAALVQLALQRFCQKYQKPAKQLSKAALQQIHQYPWPGNVRELNHVMERAVLLATSPVIDVDLLALQPPASTGQSATSSFNLADMEQQLIKQALQQTGNQLSAAADLLGITRHALARRLEKYRLQAL